MLSPPSEQKVEPEAASEAGGQREAHAPLARLLTSLWPRCEVPVAPFWWFPCSEGAAHPPPTCVLCSRHRTVLLCAGSPGPASAPSTRGLRGGRPCRCENDLLSLPC